MNNVSSSFLTIPQEAVLDGIALPMKDAELTKPIR